MQEFERLIKEGAAEGYSDLHITGGHPAVYRHHGVLHFDGSYKWGHSEIDALVENLLSGKQRAALKKRCSIDFARTIHRMRVRINVFSTTRGLSLAIRLLPGKVPRLHSLNLHPFIREYCRLQTGLILIGGSTGSGKSTTIAGMIEEINQTRPAHIITLEDPVEYRFVSQKAFVEQRELGTHTPAFDRGLLDCLREDPDVIVVGELREPEVIRLTLNAVESGHLVIASIHATNAEDALYRICNSFPSEGQDLVRSQLASTLALMVIQKLVFYKKAGFRVPLLSIMKGTPAIRGMIRDNKFAQLESIVQTGRGIGMLTMEQYQREYMEKRDTFTPPTDIFRPSEELAAEMMYRSPLITDRDQGLHTGKEAVAKTAAIPPETPSFDETLHVIEEETSMDDLLAEINLADQKGL